MLLRAAYAQKLIDALAAELITRGPKGENLRWRSRVLNPLLQRQLHGYIDHESMMLSSHFRGNHAKHISEAVGEFYLARDPLCPAEQISLRWGVIYVTNARWSLAVSENPELLTDLDHYERSRENTSKLLEMLGTGNKKGERVICQEVATILSENVQDVFKPLYPKVSLSHTHPHYSPDWCLLTAN